MFIQFEPVGRVSGVKEISFHCTNIVGVRAPVPVDDDRNNKLRRQRGAVRKNEKQIRQKINVHDYKQTTNPTKTVDGEFTIVQ